MSECRVCHVLLTTENHYNFITRGHNICIPCDSKRGRDKNLRCKMEVIEAYGGKCACCGEQEPLFLTIDHIHDNGANERRENKRVGDKMHRWLRRQGFPKDDFQLLCFNCNFAKHVLGQCPHQLNQNDIVEQQTADVSPLWAQSASPPPA
jgi:hypothetical protein